VTAPKIFGIGFHKTGTSSLGVALELLGYRVTGPNGVLDPNIREHALDLALDLVGRYDAFQDNPWPLLYRELDTRFPSSKYVFTVRPTADWIRSMKKHFGGTSSPKWRRAGGVSSPMHEWIYGFPDPDVHEQVYIDRYERHNREVREYFARRPSDFLELHVIEGEGWEKLCPFLGKAIPQCSFPHANPASVRESLADWLLHLEERAREFLHDPNESEKFGRDLFWELADRLDQARREGVPPETLMRAEQALGELARRRLATTERSLFRLAVRSVGPRIAGRMRAWTMR